MILATSLPLYKSVKYQIHEMKYSQSITKRKKKNNNNHEKSYNMAWLKCFVAAIHATRLFACITVSISSPFLTIRFGYMPVAIIIVYKRSQNNSFQLIPGQRVVMNNLFSDLRFFFSFKHSISTFSSTLRQKSKAFINTYNHP